jgi:hypothetical protein
MMATERKPSTDIETASALLADWEARTAAFREVQKLCAGIEAAAGETEAERKVIARDRQQATELLADMAAELAAGSQRALNAFDKRLHDRLIVELVIAIAAALGDENKDHLSLRIGATLTCIPPGMRFRHCKIERNLLTTDDLQPLIEGARQAVLVEQGKFYTGTGEVPTACHIVAAMVLAAGGDAYKGRSIINLYSERKDDFAWLALGVWHERQQHTRIADS